MRSIQQRARFHLLRLQNKLRNQLARWTFDASGFDDPLPCLWSRGISRFCDSRGPDDYWQAPTENVLAPELIREHYGAAHGLVWIRLSTQPRINRLADLDHFATFALPTIRHPFVLITTDGDVLVPSELRRSTVDAILASPWLRAWYTQNYDGIGIDKLFPMPIGLDLHTPRPFMSPRKLIEILDEVSSSRPPLEDLPLRVVCDIGLSLASAARVDAMAALQGCSHIDFVTWRISQAAIWKRYASSPFVLSVEGNALDCHRTWEALYLGSIVITKTSTLDSLYKDLPVVIIKDWNEIREPNNLLLWRDQYGPLTEKARIWSRLGAKRYLDDIRARALAAPS